MSSFLQGEFRIISRGGHLQREVNDQITYRDLEEGAMESRFEEALVKSNEEGRLRVLSDADLSSTKPVIVFTLVPISRHILIIRY